MKSDYDRSIRMQCPTCGSETFEHEADNPHVRCARCGLEITKDELRDANAGRIEAEADALKSELLKDVKADFARMLKNWK